MRDRRGYLLPVDADPDSAEINGYPIDLLYANLGRLDATKSVRVFLDACFSGDSDRGMLVRSASPVYVQASLPEASGDKLTVLAASSGEEVASWDDEARHGLFTHHLLEALYGAGDADGDGRVTAAEAKVYLDDTMTIAARREYRRQQNASLNGVSVAVLARAGAGGEFPARPSLDDSGAVAGGAGDAGKEGAAGGTGEGPRPPKTAEAQEEGLGLKHGERVLVQHGLLSLGHDIGVVDGAFGRRTRAGVRGYQRDKGLPETGYLTGELRDALVMLGERRREDEAAREAERERLAAERERREREKQEAARRADDDAFAEAKRLHTPAGYRSYLDRGGRHESTARALLAEVTKPKWEAGKKFRDCPDCTEMVVVPAGSYEMGSPSYEGGRYDAEGPVHRVTISGPFAVGVHEVTRGEWSRFVSETGYSSGGSCWTYEGGEYKDRAGRGWSNPGFSQSDGHPVVCVSWEDAGAYVDWLSSETGMEYRLLSESEWEYVARGGSSTGRDTGGGARVASVRMRTVRTVRLRAGTGIGRWIPLRAKTVMFTRPRWRVSGRTDLVCTTYWGTCGNGWRIAGTKVIVERLETVVCGRVVEIVASVCCVAARGSTIRGPCVPRIAAGTPPETGSALSVFASPGRWIESCLFASSPLARGSRGRSPPGRFIALRVFLADWIRRGCRVPSSLAGCGRRRWRRCCGGSFPPWTGSRAGRSSCSATAFRPRPSRGR